MRNDKDGCSTCPSGSEHFESCMIGKRLRWQYDYRTNDGRLFSCVKPTLDECRNARDAWLATGGK